MSSAILIVSVKSRIYIYFFLLTRTLLLNRKAGSLCVYITSRLGAKSHSLRATTRTSPRLVCKHSICQGDVPQVSRILRATRPVNGFFTLLQPIRAFITLLHHLDCIVLRKHEVVQLLKNQLQHLGLIRLA